MIAEHRNMLVEDAVVKIAHSYREYRQCGSTKALSLPEPYTRPSQPITAPTPSIKTVPEHQQPDKAPRRLIGLPEPSTRPSPAITAPTPSIKTVPEHQQPDTATRRLIGLLSADCELTHSELEHVILYLRFRQKALVSTSDSTGTQQANVTDSNTVSLPVDINAVNKLLLEAVNIASGR